MNILTKLIRSIFNPTPKFSEAELQQGHLIRLRIEAEEREERESFRDWHREQLRLLEEEKKLRQQQDILTSHMQVRYVEQVLDGVMFKHSFPHSEDELRHILRAAFFEGAWFNILDNKKPNAIKYKTDESEVNYRNEHQTR